jgi:hypothetical protein
MNSDICPFHSIIWEIPRVLGALSQKQGMKVKQIYYYTTASQTQFIYSYYLLNIYTLKSVEMIPKCDIQWFHGLFRDTLFLYKHLQYGYPGRSTIKLNTGGEFCLLGNSYVCSYCSLTLLWFCLIKVNDFVYSYLKVYIYYMFIKRGYPSDSVLDIEYFIRSLDNTTTLFSYHRSGIKNSVTNT